MIRRLILGGAFLVAAFASVKLFLSTSKDQHTLKFQHMKQETTPGSRAGFSITAAGTDGGKASSAVAAASHAGSPAAHIMAAISCSPAVRVASSH